MDGRLGVMNDFDINWIESNKLSGSKEIQELYEKKLGSDIIQRIKIENRTQQKTGYDIELHLADGRILTIEEKFRKSFYPDILLEIKHINGNNKIGWLYTSEAEILAYFQHYKKGYNLTLWKLKELALWSRSDQFFRLLDGKVIKEIWSNTVRSGEKWRTKNYTVSFRILRNKPFCYRNKEYEKNKNTLPLDFFKGEKDKNDP